MAIATELVGNEPNEIETPTLQWWLAERQRRSKSGHVGGAGRENMDTFFTEFRVAIRYLAATAALLRFHLNAMGRHSSEYPLW
jgi:hypothetical protein